MFSFQEIVGEAYSGKDFRKVESEIVERYEDCSFKLCNFQSLDLDKISFIDCHFDSSNLSLISVKSVNFIRCTFNNCKILNVDFSVVSALKDCAFESCLMEATIFDGLALPYIKFLSSHLSGASFKNNDLQSALFTSCELSDSSFLNCNLNDSDFSEALNYRIQLSQNSLKGSRHNAQQALGLLEGSGVIIN